MRKMSKSGFLLAWSLAAAGCAAPGGPPQPGAKARAEPAGERPAMPDWLDAGPMLIESDHVCDDGTNVTTMVSRVEAYLILRGQPRLRLPVTGPRTYSDGSNHFRQETYGLIRIELAGRPLITCSPAPIAEPQ